MQEAAVYLDDEIKSLNGFSIFTVTGTTLIQPGNCCWGV